jgi:YVTN family beta-propeller protein
VAKIPVQKPLGLAVLEDKVWVTTPSGAARIDSATNAVTATIKFGSGHDEIDAITANGAAVWVSDFDTSTVYRIDPKTLRVVAEIPVGLNPEEIFATADAVWVANHRDGTVSRIDPNSNRVVATINIGPKGPSGPQWLAVGIGSVWVSVPNLASVVRIDAATNTIQATISGPFGAIAFSPGAVWVTEPPAVVRIDPQTNQIVARVDIGGGTADPAVIDGAPWFAVVGSPGTLVRIDPATNRVDRVLALLDLDGSTPVQLTDATLARAPSGSSLWIGDASEPGRVLRFPLAQLSGQ